VQVYNSTILDLHFPAVCYRKLLSPPIPPPPEDESVLLGVVQQPTIEDLAEIMPVHFCTGFKSIMKLICVQ